MTDPPSAQLTTEEERGYRADLSLGQFLINKTNFFLYAWKNERDSKSVVPDKSLGITGFHRCLKGDCQDRQNKSSSGSFTLGLSRATSLLSVLLIGVLFEFSFLRIIQLLFLK